MGHALSLPTPVAGEELLSAWPWPGGVVSTLDFEPQCAGDKAYAAIAIIRGGQGAHDGTIVDRVVCLQCGRTHVQTTTLSAISNAIAHQELFERWAGNFADAHDREVCLGPYGDETADVAEALKDVVASALCSSTAVDEFLHAFARLSLETTQGEWGVLIATPCGIQYVDAGIAGLSSLMTLDGSPLTRDHDADIRAVVNRLRCTVQAGETNLMPVLVAVSSDAYDLGQGVRRWTLLTPTRVFTCEVGPDPEMPSTLGLAAGLDVYSTTDGGPRFIPPDRLRVAMMLSDGFDIGRPMR